ncbi:unnamed protein product [Linum trigynum]|uniref:Uncharacterized protein n=1 Tax=Linum trigynum TaxID=586398 RepID=A0AAV2GM48_9ROSI
MAKISSRTHPPPTTKGYQLEVLSPHINILVSREEPVQSKLVWVQPDPRIALDLRHVDDEPGALANDPTGDGAGMVQG